MRQIEIINIGTPGIPKYRLTIDGVICNRCTASDVVDNALEKELLADTTGRKAEALYQHCLALTQREP